LSAFDRFLQVYKVAPGSQAHLLSDQEQTRAAAGAVAGAKHQVTGGGRAAAVVTQQDTLCMFLAFMRGHPVHNPICSLVACLRACRLLSCPAALVTHAFLVLSQRVHRHLQASNAYAAACRLAPPMPHPPPSFRHCASRQARLLQGHSRPAQPLCSRQGHRHRLRHWLSGRMAH
jgi:hypothetical protein